MRSIATYDHTGFIDYLDVFNSAVDNYTTLTVAAGKKVSF
jgi:polyamine oxidase